MDDKATTPDRATEMAAGYDLFSAENVTIGIGERKKISTRVQFDIPRGYMGLVQSRSGLSYNKGIIVISSVIDADYIGEIFVCVTNIGHEAYEIKKKIKSGHIFLRRLLMIMFKKMKSI